MTTTMGMCSDKSLIGKGVDYCLTATENVCSKCSATQTCCQYNLQDLGGTTSGNVGICMATSDIASALQAGALPSYLKCAATMVFECASNSDCASNAVATTKSCCISTVDKALMNKGVCSDKSNIGKGVDYCLADSETVCNKCTSSQTCCTYNAKDDPSPSSSTTTGKIATCTPNDAIALMQKSNLIPSYMQCGSVYVAYSLFLAAFAALFLSF